MPTLDTRAARSLGLVAGCGLAAGALAAGHVPASRSAHPAQLEVVAGRSGELVLSSATPIIPLRPLRPGPRRRGLVGAVSLWNPTDVPLRVRVQGSPSGPELDGARVALRAGRETLAAQTLGDLRRSSAGEFRLQPGARKRLRLRAWLRPGSRGHEARAVSVKLNFLTSVEAR